MSRHVVRRIKVEEGEGFDLLPGEQVISAYYIGPWFYLIVLLESDGWEERSDGMAPPSDA